MSQSSSEASTTSSPSTSGVKGKQTTTTATTTMNTRRRRESPAALLSSEQECACPCCPGHYQDVHDRRPTAASRARAKTVSATTGAAGRRLSVAFDLPETTSSSREGGHRKGSSPSSDSAPGKAQGTHHRHRSASTVDSAARGTDRAGADRSSQRRVLHRRSDSTPAESSTVSIMRLPGKLSWSTSSKASGSGPQSATRISRELMCKELPPLPSELEEKRLSGALPKLPLLDDLSNGLDEWLLEDTSTHHSGAQSTNRRSTKTHTNPQISPRRSASEKLGSTPLSSAADAVGTQPRPPPFPPPQIPSFVPTTHYNVAVSDAEAIGGEAEWLGLLDIRKTSPVRTLSHSASFASYTSNISSASAVPSSHACDPDLHNSTTQSSARGPYGLRDHDARTGLTKANGNLIDRLPDIFRSGLDVHEAHTSFSSAAHPGTMPDKISNSIPLVDEAQRRKDTRRVSSSRKQKFRPPALDLSRNAGSSHLTSSLPGSQSQAASTASSLSMRHRARSLSGGDRPSSCLVSYHNRFRRSNSGGTVIEDGPLSASCDLLLSPLSSPHNPALPSSARRYADAGHGVHPAASSRPLQNAIVASQEPRPGRSVVAKDASATVSPAFVTTPRWFQDDSFSSYAASMSATSSHDSARTTSTYRSSATTVDSSLPSPKSPLCDMMQTTVRLSDSLKKSYNGNMALINEDDMSHTVEWPTNDQPGRGSAATAAVSSITRPGHRLSKSLGSAQMSTKASILDRTPGTIQAKEAEIAVKRRLRSSTVTTQGRGVREDAHKTGQSSESMIRSSTLEIVMYGVAS